MLWEYYQAKHNSKPLTEMLGLMSQMLVKDIGFKKTYESRRELDVQGGNY